MTEALSLTKKSQSLSLELARWTGARSPWGYLGDSTQTDVLLRVRRHLVQMRTSRVLSPSRMVRLCRFTAQLRLVRL
jgi:hypothetical protein